MDKKMRDRKMNDRKMKDTEIGKEGADEGDEFEVGDAPCR